MVIPKLIERPFASCGRQMCNYWAAADCPAFRPHLIDLKVWCPAARQKLGPECDALLLLWVFHHAFRTGCVKFLLVDGSIIVRVGLRKVHDVGSGVCLR